MNTKTHEGNTLSANGTCNAVSCWCRSSDSFVLPVVPAEQARDLMRHSFALGKLAQKGFLTAQDDFDRLISQLKGKKS
jgi:hypothetical protein